MDSPSEISQRDTSLMKEIALMATFITLVFLSTSLFYIPLSSTGFFNIGETFVYIAALIGGPIVGGIAGGFGAAMADMVLGFGSFAPATLVLKGLEGFVVGLLFQKSTKIDQRLKYVILFAISIFLVGFSVFFTTPILNGLEDSNIIDINIRLLDINLIPAHILDPTVEDAYQTITFSLPGIILVLISITLTIFIWIVELRMGEKGQMILSCLLAGPIIIIGYFLYEISILMIPINVALGEVPFNIAQVVFGTVLAVSVVFYLHDLGVIRKKEIKSKNYQ